MTKQCTQRAWYSSWLTSGSLSPTLRDILNSVILIPSSGRCAAILHTYRYICTFTLLYFIHLYIISVHLYIYPSIHLYYTVRNTALPPRLGRLASDLGPHLSMLSVFRTHLEKSSLDESVPVDPVKQSASQFQALSNTHFPDIKV